MNFKKREPQSLTKDEMISRLSKLLKTVNSKNLEILEPQEREGSILYLSTMTWSAIPDGLMRLSRRFKVPMKLLVLAVRQLSLLNIKGIEISFVSVFSKDFTISFSVLDNHNYLVILQNQGHGQQEPVIEPVITKEKSIFSKLVIWLLELIFSMKSAVLM